ncbi:5'/3'-nucleotidase SurE [Rhodococcus sp. HM1]|uniref:5'/3'-nucleotidase SurE n=1 Tax=unclassified Rhodococcus (in: high G+C Gram-positive bacteria) TaxID=192944 RepID=UPI0018CD884A|nr:MULTISPECIES: 5'/3'-nucleotidase SurE [unclassified Rhodococcus (in: high G+C Gram-positive bacteria)]MBH0121221.1 5'/3'-nucleotidase SurE [Rhodococcus sp. CX]MCK8671232.1 5'/3'-nucleotidase SurE [Rhodococcus sp. HM1]
MRALVTNDDGIDSRGLGVLARLAVEAGLDVVVAAPHTERSGASASLTALAEDGRLAVTERQWPDLPEVPIRAVEASPALIGFVAAHGAFGPAPDVVLSGINHGPNTGHAILHSGTVGAALTAATHGALALAVSVASADPQHWDTAEQVSRRALEWVIESGQRGSVLNINVPDVPPDEFRGLRLAPLAAFGAVQADIGEIGKEFVTVTFREIRADERDETDAGLVAQGWATATALRAPVEAADVDLEALPWTGPGLP